MNYELKDRQVALFIIAFLPLTKFFILPSIISEIAKEDMWISTIFNLVFDFLSVLAITITCKNSDTDFFGLLEKNFGKRVAKIIYMLYLIFFLFKCIVPLTEQKDYVELTLYITMPKILYFFPFFIAAFYICTKRLRIFGRSADILWLITLIGYVILISLSLGNAEFPAILPVFANGIKNIGKASFLSLPWYGDGAYLLFLVGEFEYKKKSTLKILLAFLLSAIMVILFMIIFYCTFTSIAFRQQFALTEIAKYSTVISNTGRFDYVGITMILFSNIFGLSVPIFFASKILNKVCNIQKIWLSPLIIIAILCIPLFLLSEYTMSIQDFIVKKFYIYFIVFGTLIPLLSPLLTLKEKNYEKIKV